MPGADVGILDFGAHPGAPEAELVITGQTGISAGSLVDAWLFPADTADHSADEHRAAGLRLRAGSVIPGTGFTIYGCLPAGLVRADKAKVQRTVNEPYLVSVSGFAGAAATSGAGSSWSSPSNATGADDFSTAGSSVLTGNTSMVLELSSFGLSVPTGASIKGVAVDIIGWASQAGLQQFNAVLRKPDSTASSDLGANQPWSSPGSGVVTIGGPTNLWGLSSLTPTEANNSAFTFLGKVANTAGSTTIASWDALKMWVYYATTRAKVESYRAAERARLYGKWSVAWAWS